MNKYRKDIIERFTAGIQPFMSLWRSLVIRVGWTNLKGKDVVVYLNATFEVSAPERIKKPINSPTVNGLNADWFILPATEIEVFLANLKEGYISVGGKKLELLIRREATWEDSAFNFTQTVKSAQSTWDVAGVPVIYLQGSGSRLDTDFPEALTLQSLKSAWLALPHPYSSVGDVLKEYFELNAEQSESYVIFVHARIPISFKRVGINKLGVAIPLAADTAKVSIGQIVSSSMGADERAEIKGDSLQWERAGGDYLGTIDLTNGGTRAGRVHSILRYQQIVFDEAEVDVKKSSLSLDAMSVGGQNAKNNPNLSPDKPLTNPTDDCFGFAPFAAHLADSVVKMSPTEGIVVGLYGPWGSGKSTLLNFLEHYLNEIPQVERPTIVHFNPWLFSGHEDLVQLFFSQLLVTLNKRGQEIKKARKSLARFAVKISVAAGPWAQIINPIMTWLGTNKSITDEKKIVEAALRGQPKRILVIVDDIDRLVAEEIRQVFRLVKSVANFPNITYLLAFDKDVAIKAISDLQHTSGEDYLEKIIQVPFELPAPDAVALRKLLFEHLDHILDGTPKGLFDQTYWGNVYYEGIDHFIFTPRDVMRLTNTLRVTYPAVRGEVNPVDFVAIETLRVFCPEVYSHIRENAEEFTGAGSNSVYAKTDEIRKRYDIWLQSVPEVHRAVVKNFLMRIFPRLSGIWGNTIYGPESLMSWRKSLKISSPEVFPVYFRMAVPENAISASELRLILALIDDQDAFTGKLLSLAMESNPEGSTRVRAFLERFTDYVKEDIRVEQTPTILRSIFTVADQLLKSADASPRGMFDFGMDVQIGRLFWQLLKKVKKEDRGPLLIELLSNAKALSFAVREVGVLGQQHGKYGAKEKDSESEQLVDESVLTTLEQSALKLIVEAAAAQRLLETPELPMVLHRWRDWGGEAPVRGWVSKAIESNFGLFTLLAHFLQTTYSQSVSDVVTKSKKRLNPKWLQSFADIDAIATRLKSMESEDIPKGDVDLAVRQFLMEYTMIQDGKNPDAPFAWEE